MNDSVWNIEHCCEEIKKVVKATGFVDVDGHFPVNIGYYQPKLTARKI
ncbi:hypothetical protein [Lysinibacillus sp. FSL W8-0992]